MELKEGYKKTEVGIIPEDWSISELEELADFASGTTPKREFHEKYYNNGSNYWVKTLDLNNSNISDTDEKVTDTALKETSSLKVFPPDTVLIAMYGGFNQIGRTGILKIHACVNQALTAIKPNKSKLNPLYLQYSLNYRINHWKDVATSSRKDPNITSKDVKRFNVILPPTTDEQTAIATALSDTDALITSLEKLIVKKRMIKQGTMQKLLTPKADWEVKKLGDIGKCHRGVSYNPDADLHLHENNSTVRLFRSNNIQNSKVDYEGLQFVNHSRVKENQILEDGDIVVCMANGSKQLVGKSAIFISEDNLKYTFGAFMGCFRTDKKLAVNLFVSEIFKTNQFRNFIDVLLSGSSINNLNPGNIESIQYPFPDLKEQDRIATILSDMDSEIEALETKLAKYKQIKQGMMQQLLTGKIRLVKPERNVIEEKINMAAEPKEDY